MQDTGIHTGNDDLMAFCKNKVSYN